MNTPLAAKRCIPCEIGTPPLTDGETQKLLADIPSWEIEEGKLTKNFKFRDFLGSINFVNELAEIAEQESHHPDIYIYYNKVKLTLSTHAAKGLTENDFILAAKIDELKPAI